MEGSYKKVKFGLAQNFSTFLELCIKKMRALLTLLIGIAIAIPQPSLAAIFIPHPAKCPEEVSQPDPQKPFLRARIRYHYRQLKRYSRKLLHLAFGLAVGFGLIWLLLRQFSETAGGLPGWVALILGIWITFFIIVAIVLILMWITWPFRLLFWWISVWGWKRRFARCFRFK